jgi:hypothetical protein
MNKRNKTIGTQITTLKNSMSKRASKHNLKHISIYIKGMWLSIMGGGILLGSCIAKAATDESYIG